MLLNVQKQGDKLSGYVNVSQIKCNISKIMLEVT